MCAACGDQEIGRGVVTAESLLENPKVLELVREALSNLREPTVYTTESLATELGVTPRTVRRAIENGELPAFRRAGKWAMLAEDVKAWVVAGAPKNGRRRQASRRPPRAPSRGAAAMLATVETSPVVSAHR
jgi:excisionase family DNA binding protein